MMSFKRGERYPGMDRKTVRNLTAAMLMRAVSDLANLRRLGVWEDSPLEMTGVVITKVRGSATEFVLKTEKRVVTVKKWATISLEASFFTREYWEGVCAVARGNGYRLTPELVFEAAKKFEEKRGVRVDDSGIRN